MFKVYHALTSLIALASILQEFKLKLTRCGGQVFRTQDQLLLLPQHIFCRGPATADKLLLLLSRLELVRFATHCLCGVLLDAAHICWQGSNSNPTQLGSPTCLTAQADGLQTGCHCLRRFHQAQSRNISFEQRSCIGRGDKTCCLSVKRL